MVTFLSWLYLDIKQYNTISSHKYPYIGETLKYFNDIIEGKE